MDTLPIKALIDAGRDSGDEKVVAPKAPSFLAVNKDTGKVVWQDNSPGEGILHGQWSSAAVATVDGVPQAIFPGGDGWLYSFNARTGEKLWRFDLNPKDAVWPKTRNYGVSTPVFTGGRVFMSVGQDPDHPNGVGHTYAIDPARTYRIRGNVHGACYTSFTVEAKGTVPTKGLWDTAVDMEVVYQFKNPDWTLVWGQPGNKVGKTEFGNVFWGDRGPRTR